jgi:glutathione S-transferase
MKMIIGSKRYSTWSLRPWLLYRYFGLPFDEEVILFETKPGARELADQTKAHMRSVSPNGRLPVLHTDQRLWINESLSICEYANEHFLEGRAWPAEPEKRYLAKSRTLEMATGFLGLRQFLPMSIGAATSSISPAPPGARADIDRVIDILHACLEPQARPEFLFGPFGIVDAFYAPIVFRFETYRVEVPSIVGQYFQRLSSLAAMKEWCDAAAREPALIDEIDAIVRSYPEASAASCKI